MTTPLDVPQDNPVGYNDGPADVALISATDKKAMLARLQPQTPTQLLKRELAADIGAALQMPFDLTPADYRRHLFKGTVDMVAVSTWLRTAEYCLTIDYYDDVIERLYVHYYEHRCYPEEAAIRQVDVNKRDSPVYI